MSLLRVNSVTNKLNNGAPLISGGLISSSVISPGMNVSGILTASSFVGDGSQITNLPVISKGKAYSLGMIFSFGECHRY
jgi:hypothetical protein